MAYQGPRLRGGWNSPMPYPLGQIPDSIIQSVASNLVYSSAVGRRDISGRDWGDIFAAAINGTHFSSSLGIADVALGNTAWSAKTLTSNLSSSTVRLISGRNNVGYSFGNNSPLDDIQTTGSQVLQIWNERVDEARAQYPHLRTIVLMRDMERFAFKIFEYTPVQFDPADYIWSLTRNGQNINGHPREGGSHKFVWQSNGGQFTIIQRVSGSARSFSVRRPEPIDQLNPQQVLDNIGYSEDWVTFF